MTYSFIELQEEYKIIIPQLQRDYAQGRQDPDNENRVKSYDFLLKIIEVLTHDYPALNLDFIYGYTKEISKDRFAFIPLDGQQRLTTLWLLHWYLSPKVETEQNDITLHTVSDELKELLKDFTYETRNSSRRFCEELINNPLPVSDDINAAIRDANWFMSSWEHDPTVVSMLNMLGAIQAQAFDEAKDWENLSEKRKITFDYIDIKSEEFKLTDELYIKMNSRGKPLTSFENFKAKFSEILSANDTDFVDERLDFQDTKVTFQEYFAFKIDGIWTDLFWNFKKSKTEEINISSCFMNFFIYIAQMCYFKDNLNKNTNDFKNDFRVFKWKSNAMFLFNTLDLFYKISMEGSGQVNTGKIDTLFENLFLKDSNDASETGQVCLFDNDGVNLFEKCLLEGNQFDNRNRIILYCLISYAVKYELKGATEEFRFNIRVIRNLLQATRQRNETVYNTNVRINSFGNYWKLFNQLQEKPNIYERLLDDIDNRTTEISDDSVKNEKEKAVIIVNRATALKPEDIKALFQLEEFRHFGGLIHNLSPEKNAELFIDWSAYVREIWSCKDAVIGAALIACGFSGFETKGCSLGSMWYWGKKDNWNTILAGQKPNKELSEPVTSLLTRYGEIKSDEPAALPEDILITIVNEFLDSLDEKTWPYYFCTYRKYFLVDTNYYSWQEDEFEHEILGITGYNPLLSYHINPYVKTAASMLNDSICDLNMCYSRYSYESSLKLKNGYELLSSKNGWVVSVFDNLSIPDELKTKYNIDENNTFTENTESDRILVAVKFCNDLYKEMDR